MSYNKEITNCGQHLEIVKDNGNNLTNIMGPDDTQFCILNKCNKTITLSIYLEI